jgi:hypothetical protein
MGLDGQRPASHMEREKTTLGATAKAANRLQHPRG